MIMLLNQYSLKSTKIIYIQEKIIVGVLYRPPGNDIRTFNEKLESIFQKLRRKNKSCIICDFNINLLQDDCHQPAGHFFTPCQVIHFCHWLQDQQEWLQIQSHWLYFYHSFWHFFAVQWGYISDWYHRSLPDIPYQSSNNCLWDWSIHGKKTV